MSSQQSDSSHCQKKRVSRFSARSAPPCPKPSLNLRNHSAAQTLSVAPLSSVQVPLYCFFVKGASPSLFLFCHEVQFGEVHTFDWTSLISKAFVTRSWKKPPPLIHNRGRMCEHHLAWFVTWGIVWQTKYIFYHCNQRLVTQRQ